MHLSIAACRRYVYVENPEEAYKGTSFSPRCCITILNNARTRRLLFKNDAKSRAEQMEETSRVTGKRETSLIRKGFMALTYE